MILTGCAGKQLIENDGDRVEPVECLGRGTVRYTLSIVTLAEVPQPNLVKVMETKSLGDRVDDTRVWYRLGDDVCQVEFDEVDALFDATALGCVPNLDQDHEDNGDEK